MNARQEKPRKRSELIVSDMLSDPDSPRIIKMIESYKKIQNPDKDHQIILGRTAIEWEDAETDVANN